jgi:alpha-1,6-mannosyltransferase
MPGMPLDRRFTRKLIALGGVQSVLIAAIVLIGDLRHAVPSFLAIYFTAFLVYLLAVRQVLRAGPVAEQNLLWVIVLFALAFRAAMLFSEPTLSDDIFRYVWDGRVLNHGIDPYRYAPSAAALAPLRDSLYAHINNRDVGTPYAPLTLAVFALLQHIGNSPFVFKLGFIIADGLIMLVLLRLFERTGTPRVNLLIYAWNPLVIVEVAGSGHSDPLAVLLLLIAIYTAMANHPRTATAGLTLAILGKYFTVAVVPLFWRNFRGGAWILIPAGLVAAFAAFSPSLENHVLSLATVFENWRFNDSLFALVYWATGSLPITRFVVVAGFLALVVTVVRLGWPLPRAVMTVLGGMFLLTSTFEPWYMVWIVPFLCLYPNRAWLLLTGLIMLSYEVLIRFNSDGLWAESPWLRWAIFAPFFALLVGDAVARARRRSRA